MKLYMMHLMPYADLDLDYDKTYNSAWITLPNSYYDPKKGAKLYNRYLDELEYADQLGFDGVCVNAHHQNAYGLMPQPGVMAGALVRREAKPHVENFLSKFLRMTKEMLLAPGYLSLKSMMGVMKAKSAIGGQQTIDDVIDKGMFICGSPETVRQQLEHHHTTIGFGHLLTLLQFGTLPAELTRKSMEIFASAVMPGLRASSAPQADARLAEATT